MKVKISTISNILLVLVLFPYVSLFRTPFDTQPFALIFSVLLFLTLFVRGKDKNITSPLIMWFLGLVLLYASSIYFINSDYHYGLRSLAGYASVFFIAFASYKTFKYISVKVYLISVFIWFFVGIVQLLCDKMFAIWLVPRMATSVERGITSLAVEPSFYAIACIFFLVLNEVFRGAEKYGTKLYFAIAAISSFQILVSYSGVGLLFWAIFFCVKAIATMNARGIVNRKTYSILLVSVAVPIFIFYLFMSIPALQNTRAGSLLSGFINDPWAMLHTDASVADRTAHVLLPLSSLVYSGGIGLGLGTWNDYAHALHSWFLEGKLLLYSVDGRIMSGWGSAVYELGIIGLLFMFAFIWTIFMGMRRMRRNSGMKSAYVIGAIVVFIIMFMAVPLALPLFGYIWGVFLYYAYADLTVLQKRLARLE